MQLVELKTGFLTHLFKGISIVICCILLCNVRVFWKYFNDDFCNDEVAI